MKPNKQRLSLLTEEEVKVYRKEMKVFEKEKQRVSVAARHYRVFRAGRISYILTYNERSKNPRFKEKPDFEGTGMALAGILYPGETIEEFVLHMKCMEAVIKLRVRDMKRRYDNAWYENQKIKTII